jgi:uncharacterized membrane protein
MTDLKSWLQSRTIWMVLVTLTPFLSKLLGFDLGATMDDILTIAGAVGAIYFRITATQKVTAKLPKLSKK